ncbi:hypothetical protein Tco_1043049 [Tanacetum coccineum]|uniref:Uncharacterized protein n=1 Tax=Tanacetum coccineum TaxID=301880 RepID=A0ABQ5GMA4_9ASTR
MPCSCDRRRMWDRRVSIGQTLNENSGMSTLEPLMELRIKQCTGKYNHSIGNKMVRKHDERGAGINMMPKSLFEHLKLANLKKTSMVIEMVIDTLEEPDETILLGRPFLATIHAQIDVFRGEILLGESEYFNPHEMENDDSPALEQRTFHYSEESVDTVDSSSDKVSSDEDVDEWLNEELSKRMNGQDKEEEEDALIDILKTVVEECKSIYKKAQIRTPSSRTSEIQGVSFVAQEKEGDSSETLPYQQPSNETNPGSFTLPLPIG